MICPILALGGSSGMAKVHVCVDFTLLPSGIVTVSGFVANSIDAVGAAVTKK